MSALLSAIAKRTSAIRAILYGGYVVTLVTTLLYAYTHGDAPLAFVGRWIVGILLAVVALEYVLLWARFTKGRITVGKSQGALIEAMGIPLDQQLAMAKHRIDLLGRSFKSFTDRAENVRALRRAECEVRILMLHPLGPGVSEIARARRELRTPIRDGYLAEEIKNSIVRCIRDLGRDRVLQILRLYQSPSTCAVYRIDDAYLVTVYTSGHGASSPALCVASSQVEGAFCQGFDRSFEEIWEADSTVKLTEELLNSLGI
ncbi:MAG: hypothetical protein IT348_16970 [Candidatus Eisenbacteria bacterium]|nr:hypothetical protein [Candidatus Eisenbacteria bacterium]